MVGIIKLKMRIEVFYKNPKTDGRAARLRTRLSQEYPAIEAVRVVDVYLIEAVPELTPQTARHLFSDSVAQKTLCLSDSGRQKDDQPENGDTAPVTVQETEKWDYLIEIGYKPGVTDPIANTAKKTIMDELQRNGTSPDARTDSWIIQTARQYLFALRRRTMGGDSAEDPHSTSPKPNIRQVAQQLYNPLIQHAVCISRKEWEEGERPPFIYPETVDTTPPDVEMVEIESLNDEELKELSRSRLLALSLSEMRAIRHYFSKPDVLVERSSVGLRGGITDVELEMIAQTWSEHCKHKIFNAIISYSENGKTTRVSSLFSTYIQQTTELLRKEKGYLRSVFHDNSGVIAFDDRHLLCFKAETHNSPSALDPYGGAITGIVGVNRDIIGTGKGAKPIFNTNVLCFGYPDTPASSLPKGLLHPAKVMDGVHRGIIDGGNQSGIPTVAGAFLFDESFTGKPLVFCGTGGILPAEIDGEGGWINHVHPGDNAVMVGGRIGKDGIHGATFSSQLLDETSPTSAVQIGDPITQKKMLDFLLEARDKGLYCGITDNGAGGLSSSLGEMAEKSGGVIIELDRCPLKYEGLAPWEILLSESQERMSLAVPPEKTERLMKLAERRDVEAKVVGAFTDSGNIEIMNRGKTVGLIQLDFLHNGVPVMELEAEWIPPADAHEETQQDFRSGAAGSLREILLSVLSDPNVASKERLVRQYDHEVQGKSILKPFTGVQNDGPSDGAVLRPLFDSYRGITVTHGICPRLSDFDTSVMAMCAVDEAYRAHIGCGGLPEQVSALDNFCWPDPVESERTPDGKFKLAQLVRACRGLQEACVTYGIPLISGKDSMKNDAEFGGRKVSVRPTLLISLIGIIEDVRETVTTDVKQAGDLMVLLGESGENLGGSVYELVTGVRTKKCPRLRPGKAKLLYNALSNCIRKGLIASCHDISDGGLAAAVAESCLGGRLGARLNHEHVSHGFLFNEAPSRYILTVRPENWEQFATETDHLPVAKLGTVIEEPSLHVESRGAEILNISLKELEKAWKSRWER